MPTVTYIHKIKNIISKKTYLPEISSNAWKRKKERRKNKTMPFKPEHGDEMPGGLAGM